MTDELSGAQRVATFLLSLDEASAATILGHLGGEIVEQVAEEMTRLELGDSGHKRVVELYRNLALEAGGPKRVLSRKDDELSKLLTAGLGASTANSVVNRIQERRQHEQPFSELEQYPPNLLTVVLNEESPPVCALVLAHMDPTISALVLSNQEPEIALDVVKRMANLVPPGIEILRAIAADLLERLKIQATKPPAPDPVKRLKTIAEMLNFTNEQIEAAVLSGLAADDAEAAQEIREHMFGWDDLATIDKRSMQKILGSVDTRTLAIALKASPKPVEDNITANLSARVKDMVIEERELAGATALTEVEACRQQVMTTVRGLIEAGEFSPARQGEELVT